MLSPPNFPTRGSPSAHSLPFLTCWREKVTYLRHAIENGRHPQMNYVSILLRYVPFYKNGWCYNLAKSYRPIRRGIDHNFLVPPVFFFTRAIWAKIDLFEAILQVFSQLLRLITRTMHM